MRTTVLLIFAVFLAIAGKAQFAFEKIITKGSLETAWSVIQTTDGGYAFLGTIVSPPAYDIWLVKTNYMGDTTFTKTFRGIGTNDTGDRSLVQSSDGGYTFFANRNGKTDLFHTSSTGDSLWEKELCNGVGKALSQSSDLGYTVSAADSIWSLLRVVHAGPSGDVVWLRTYHMFPQNTGHSCYSWSVRETPDHGFIVAGALIDAYSVSHPFMLRTGPTGDSLWYREFNYSWMLDATFYSADTAGNNGYIACGLLGTPNQNAFVMRFNAEGDTLWTRVLYASGFQYFNSLRTTADGGAIACGSYSDPYPRDSSRLYLVKFTSSGDISWEKRMGNYHNSYGLSVESTNDHGYIICGEVEQLTTSDHHGLLIKTDNNGNITGTADDPPQFQARIYPNPLKDRLNIEISNKNCQFCLFDQMGRPVLEKRIAAYVESIDVTALSTGLYFYKISQNGTVIGSGTLMKSGE